MITPHNPAASEELARIARIRDLNDALRTCRDPRVAMTLNGSIIFTRSIVERGEVSLNRVFAAVASFDAFTHDNDPHGEHDMAFIDVDGERVFFKIDYYDPTMSWHSDDASDPTLTRRVLTIGLAEDY